MERWSVRIDEERALEIARAILSAPEVIEGLTPAECRLVHAVRVAKGRVRSRDDLSEICATDPLNPPFMRAVDVWLSKIKRKRPDIGDRIESVWGRGLRWVGE